MIISCINCYKKFEVSSNLIPESGRTIQCGSCGHTWFFKKDENNQKFNLEQKRETKLVEKFKDDEKITKTLKKRDVSRRSDFKSKDYQLTKYKTKSIFSIERFFSYILVIIISIIALIIILDTFKNPLYENFPHIETILFNLFEVIKDISLFIKDLFK